MIKTVIFIIFIQVYFFSLPLIGHVFIKYINNKFHANSWVRNVYNYYAEQPLIIKFLLSFMIAAGIFGTICIPFYLFHIPAALYSLLYMVLAVTSLCYLLKSPRHLYKNIKRMFCFKKRTSLRYAVIVAVTFGLVVFDFILSLILGGTIKESHDVFVHLAKIATLIRDNFSLYDTFFGTVIESRYHINLVHALYVPPVQLSEIGSITTMPSEVWRYSLGFFRLLQWAAVYTFVYVIFTEWLKIKNSKPWALLGLVAAISFSAGSLYYANYPNILVTVWIITFVVGLIQLMNKHAVGAPLIILSSLLISLTHPTYSVLMILFTIFFGCILAIFRKGKLLRHELIIFIAAGVILSSAALITKLFPNILYPVFSTETLAISYSKFFPTSPHLILSSILMILFIIVVAYMYRRLGNESNQKAVLIALVLLLPVVVLNPIGTAIFGKVFHASMFYRFGAINILYVVIIPVIAYLTYATTRNLHQKSLNRRVLSYLGYGFCTLACAFSIGNAYTIMVSQLSAAGPNEYSKLHKLHDGYNKYLKNKAVVLADENTSYILPQTFDIRVVSIYWAHATPNSAALLREQCKTELFRSMRLTDLKAAKVDNILLSKKKQWSRALIDKINTLPYVEKLKEDGSYVLFSVNKKFIETDPELPAVSCASYEKKELSR